MKKTKTKYLFASDLDGTFFTKYYESIHFKNYEAIKKIQEEGHIFVPVTGRSHWFVENFAKNLDLKHGGVYFHGAWIEMPNNKDFKAKTGWTNKWMKPDLVKNIFRTQNLFKYIDMSFITGKDKHIYYDNQKEIDKLFYDSGEVVMYFKKDIDLAKAKKIGDAINNMYGDKVEAFVWEKSPVNWLVLVPNNVNKALALAQVAKYYNIPRENIIYFGDGSNDIDAIKYAGISVAPANALPLIKQHAKHVAKEDSTQGAVGEFILDFLKKHK